MDNYLLAYYQTIQNGSVVVGRWVRMFYEYIVKGLQTQAFFFDQRRQTGPSALSRPSAPLRRPRRSAAAGTVAEGGGVGHLRRGGADGLRQFREVVIVIGRKNGKSLFAAAIIAYCVFLDGSMGQRSTVWRPAGPGGDRVLGVLADDCEKPELAVLIRRRKSDLYVEGTNSSVKKLAFNAKKADGFNPHLTVCDEIASWPGEQGLKQYEVMKSALGARKQPLLLSISTSGYVNEGIYDELMKRSTRFLLGDSREHRLAPFLYMIDDIQKWNDINELRKSNPNLGVSVSVDYCWRRSPSRRGACPRRRSSSRNTATSNKTAARHGWTPRTWKKPEAGAFTGRLPGVLLRGRYRPVTHHRPDGLRRHHRKRGQVYVFAQFFLPAERIEAATARDGLPYAAYVQRGLLVPSGDNFVDYHDCFVWYRNLVEQFQIYPLKVGYDRYTAQYLVQDMKQYGFHMDDVCRGTILRGDPGDRGLMRDGVFRIGDNDLLKAHLLDASLKIEAESGRCKPVKLSATRI